jgi:hypothetical protein
VSEPKSTQSVDATARELPPWLVGLRRFVNLVYPTLLGALMVFAALPSEQLPDRLKPKRERLSQLMRKVSLSQSWKMYAPDPPKGHFYMELYAHDVDGTVRRLEDSRMAEEGWGTAWAWNRTRRDIWHLTVTRHIDKVNRNRTWYLRGVCLREARRGYQVKRLEMIRVYRRIRAPDRVQAGAELLGPIKRTKAQDGSCNVAIIREMIAEDPLRADGGDGR